MKYSEMEQLLQYVEYQDKIYMPNEIFEDLKKNISNSSHLGFAYSYIYFTTWLYRYAKYGSITELIDQKFIKKILGYNENYKKIDYLIKKNGILEQMDYIRTTNDFPISYEYDELDGLKFYYVSEQKEYEKKHNQQNDYLNIPKNFKIKFPVKAFYRYTNDEEFKENYENGYEDGTFFYVDNTHLVPFEAFLFSMTNEDIGCTGFYLYAFLRSKTQIYGGYDIPLEELIEETGIPHKTLCRYLDALKKYNMIYCDVQDYIIGLGKGQQNANTYYVNDPVAFVDNPKTYQKRKVMSVYTYYKKLEEQAELEANVEQQIDTLPSKF